LREALHVEKSLLGLINEAGGEGGAQTMEEESKEERRFPMSGSWFTLGSTLSEAEELAPTPRAKLNEVPPLSPSPRERRRRWLIPLSRVGEP
jgi:hypothetical protein